MSLYQGYLIDDLLAKPGAGEAEEAPETAEASEAPAEDIDAECAAPL